MRVFIVNWDKFILLLLPTFLRKRTIVAFLRSVLFPIKQVYARFTSMRDNNLFLMKYDTSRRNLEIALRIRFEDEGIYIENAVYDEGLYLDFYLEDYIRPAGFHTERIIPYIGDLYLDFWLEKEIMTDDFVIYVPEATFLTNEARDRRITDFAFLFTLPGFKFSVVRY